MGPLATVHGVVLNALTGQPLPRALVRIEGDAESGALTDGDGRYEISGVPIGPQAFQVLKPGFRDRPTAAAAEVLDEDASPTHNVLVAAVMPDVVFSMAPTGAIHGQIELSTGDPAQGITVMLLKRAVQDGRALWQGAGTARTNSEGLYRFGGLTDGVYAMYTEPAMDNEPATDLMEAGRAPVERAGYASVFYPDARDLAGAAHIQLRGGDQAQANLTLALEPFHAVTATVTFPQDRPSGSGPAEPSCSALAMDAAGHQLPYRADYDREKHTIKAQLPDGTYTFLVSSVPSFRIDFSGRTSNQDVDAGPMVGTAVFSVAGRPLPNVRVPLAASHPNPVQLTIVHTSLSPAQTTTGQPGAAQGGNAANLVLLSQTSGWINTGMVSVYANGSGPGPMEATYLMPGSYWAHAHIGQRGLCEASFTAGGANLAREPVVIGPSGAMAPMELTLRDDCASLKLMLPQNLLALAPGEEPYFTVYVVPDFDSTVDVEPQTLRLTSGGSVTLENLTPGNYHVYTFAAPLRLEYHNPAALAALPNPGQTVSLSPGSSGNLVLEEPRH